MRCLPNLVETLAELTALLTLLSHCGLLPLVVDTSLHALAQPVKSVLPRPQDATDANPAGYRTGGTT